MTETFANLSSSLLDADIDDDDDTLTVADADSAPNAFPLLGNFRIVVDDEIMLVGARTGNTFTSITREIEGTVAAAHDAGAEVVHVLTVGGFDQGVAERVELVVMQGSGSPEGVVTADPMVMYRDTLHNDLYLKAGGTGNTGWVLITRPPSGAHAGWAIMSADDHPQYVQDALVNAKGDLLVATANDTITRFAVGTDNYVLVADSTQTAGVRWG